MSEGKPASECKPSDIMAEAARAQLTGEDMVGPSAIKAVAPAKVNLFLDVGPERPDGLHDVLTVMHALTLHDVIHLSAADRTPDEAHELDPVREAWVGDASNIYVRVTMMDKGAALDEAPLCADNLACKAVDALARATGRQEPAEVRIHIEKSVPSQAGLGGGSSDAASVLACLASSWGVDDPDVLALAAASIGADVAFFLQGGAALMQGAGEGFERSLEPMTSSLVLVKPPFGVSTKRAYQAYDACGEPAPCALRQEAQGATRACDVPLFNSLTKPVASICPKLGDVQQWLGLQDGVDEKRVLMSGSGSALFAMTESFADASKIASAAKCEGLWARATSFSRLRAQAL